MEAGTFVVAIVLPLFLLLRFALLWGMVSVVAREMELLLGKYF